MPTDQEKYCNCMSEVIARLGLVSSIGAKQTSIGEKQFDVEVAFLQFRKVLEVIAFSSLIANVKAYSAAHQKFTEHWNATWLLRDIQKLNPEFYPVPIRPPKKMPDGTKHCELLQGGYLTIDEFVVLYDAASNVLHSRNPFTTKSPVVRMPYSPKDWVSRIRRLIALHTIRLLDGGIWIVQAEEGKPIHMAMASPS